MINKETFCKLIDLIIGFNSQMDMMEDDHGIILYDSFLYNTPHDLFDASIKMVLTEEGVDFVYWWLYEDDDKTVETKDGLVHLDESEKLYEYLVFNKMFI